MGLTDLIHLITGRLCLVNPRWLHGREEAEYNTAETTMKITHPFPLMLNTPKGNRVFFCWEFPHAIGII